MKRLLKQRKGFTLMEISAVVVIVGILAAVAYPQYLTFLGRMRNQEVISLFYSIYAAQRQFAIENNGNYDATGTNLGITIPALKNFTNLRTDFRNSARLNGSRVARVDANDGTYRLYMFIPNDTSQPPQVGCRNLGTAPVEICQQMGLAHVFEDF